MRTWTEAKQPATVATPSTPCFSDTQILLILDGTIKLAADAQAEEHIDQCDECRSLLIALLRTEVATIKDGLQTPQYAAADPPSEDGA